MSRLKRLEQERAILAHRAHLNLLRGMAGGIAKVLPRDLHFLIITFSEEDGTTAGYVSNGRRGSIAEALRQTAQAFI